jgi:MYXO-CTERM domain-containing protein
MTAGWSAWTKRWAAAALGIVGTAVVAGCGEEQGAFEVDDGSLRGTLAIYISDHPDGHSETHYYLRDASDQERRLRFDSPPNVEPGARLKVWASLQDDGLRVTSFEKVAGPPSVAPAVVAATPFAPRSFAFVLVDIGGGVNVTAETLKDRLINNTDSIRNYYLGDSYGMQDMTAEVFGPISYPLSGCENGDTANLARNLRPMVPGTFQHYLWYFGSRTSQCDWSGLASLGTPETPSRDTWYNGSTSCVVLVQEPGHNFGMQHSSSLACDGAAFADDPNQCTASEYGDPFDPMGGGCRHMNAWQKAYQGWFGGCNGVTVTSSGTFTLNAIERACDGVQFLQIKAPKTRLFQRPAGGGGQPSTETFAYYYIELRTPYDFDGTLGNTKPLTPMVLVHVADDLHTRTQRGVHTFLLDMTPSTTGRTAFNDAGLAVGKTFSDPAGGLDITVQALSADGATIVVDMPAGNGAGPTCLDGTAFTPPGPGVESCGTPMPTGAGGSTGGSTGAGGSPGEEPWPGAGGEGHPVPQAGANGCACTSAGAPLASPVIATPILLLLIFLVAADRRSRRM